MSNQKQTVRISARRLFRKRAAVGLTNRALLLAAGWLFLVMAPVWGGGLSSGARTGAQVVLLARGDHNYPPYEYLAERGQPNGFNVEVLEAVARVMGLDIRIGLESWGRVRSDLEQGRIDIITGMYYSPERDRKVDFSVPHIMVSHGIFIRKGSSIRSLKELKGKAVIVQRGDIMDDYVSGKSLSPNIIRVKDQLDALRLLSSGRYDAALIAKLQGQYLLDRYGLSNVKAVGPPILPRKYCFAVREGNRELLLQLNEGLSIIKATGRYDEIYNKWFGVYREGFLESRHLGYFLMFLAPLVLLLIAAFLWSWSLKKTVRRRTADLVEANWRLQGEIAAHKKAAAALESAEARLEHLVFRGPVVIYAVNPEPELPTAFISPNIEDLMGYSPESFYGDSNFWIDRIHPQDRERIKRGLSEIRESDHLVREYRFRRSDGTYRWMHDEEILVRDEIGKPVEFIGYWMDITEIKNSQQEKESLEAQLRQSQKMEAIGTLAGGLAHNFNNILQAISGYVQLLLMGKDEDDPDRNYLTRIDRSGKRASELIGQILTVSRKSETRLVPVDLNQEIAQTAMLLERIIPGMVEIKTELAPDLDPIKGDPAQLEQVIMNLGTNARDAMPQGGRLVIKTENVFLDEEFCRTRLGMDPGPHVLLEVSDTGPGIAKENIQQIFEPFFTTKEKGQGTGLGLSMVYGIVKGHGGEIICQSEPGQGAIFHIYIPGYKEKIRVLRGGRENENGLPGGRELILLVDDEESILEIGRELLTRVGYRVMEARSGEEALELLSQNDEKVDLVILDLSMPGMGGHQALLRLRESKPDAKVIIASGFSAKIQIKDSIQAGASGFIAKPYRLSDMLKEIRTVLDG